MLTMAAVTAGSLAALVATVVVEQGAVSDARKAQRAAEDRPPTVVTKQVTVSKPVFGESVLYGAYAAGQIHGGFYMDGAGNVVYTPDDATCSKAYNLITTQMASTQAPIDRMAFINACETDINTTARQDPGK
jgi:hypothetical protein